MRSLSRNDFFAVVDLVKTKERRKHPMKKIKVREVETLKTTAALYGCGCDA